LADQDAAADGRAGQHANAVVGHHEVTRYGARRRSVWIVALRGRNLALPLGLVPSRVARGGEGLVVALALELFTADVVLDELVYRGALDEVLVVVDLEVALD